MVADFYFAHKTFFPKNLLPNSGCGLSTGAAYTRVNTVRCNTDNQNVVTIIKFGSMVHLMTD